MGGSKIHRILGLEETLKHNYVLSDVPSVANESWGCVAIIKCFSLPGSFTRRFSSHCAKKSPLLTAGSSLMKQKGKRTLCVCVCVCVCVCSHIPGQDGLENINESVMHFCPPEP